MQNLKVTLIPTIQAYDVKAEKKVTLEIPQPHQMKNGTLAIKGTIRETGKLCTGQ